MEGPQSERPAGEPENVRLCCLRISSGHQAALRWRRMMEAGPTEASLRSVRGGVEVLRMSVWVAPQRREWAIGPVACATVGAQRDDGACLDHL